MLRRDVDIEIEKAVDRLTFDIQGGDSRRSQNYGLALGVLAKVRQKRQFACACFALEKRGLLKRSQKEGDERSKFSELTDAGVAKIQGAAKDLLKAEESFFL